MHIYPSKTCISDDLTGSVKEVKVELVELNTLLGERFSELIACFKQRMPADVTHDPPPQI